MLVAEKDAAHGGKQIIREYTYAYGAVNGARRTEGPRRRAQPGPSGQYILMIYDRRSVRGALNIPDTMRSMNPALALTLGITRVTILRIAHRRLVIRAS